MASTAMVTPMEPERSSTNIATTVQREAVQLAPVDALVQ
jgi:hypothetical protein